MKYVATAGGLMLAAIGAVFVGVTYRGIRPRLSCVADIALLVLMSLLGMALLFWYVDTLNIPSRDLFEPAGAGRRDWRGRLVLAALVGLGLLMIGVEIAKCVLIGGHV